MGKSERSRAGNRAPRVRLAGTVLALLRLENGRQVRARLHQLSISGGLLYLDKPLDEGIKIEVIFHVGKSTVRNKARMLFPMWATQGYLQPFEFDGLGESERQDLQANLQSLLQSAAAAVVSLQDKDAETSGDGNSVTAELSLSAPDSAAAESVPE